MTRQKVMIVESDIAIKHMVTYKLVSLGYDVISQSNGDTALKVAQDELPDLIIASSQLPGLSGVELAQRLSDLPQMENTKVLLLTNAGLEVDIISHKGGHITGVLAKPFTQSSLREAIECAFGSATTLN